MKATFILSVALGYTTWAAAVGPDEKAHALDYFDTLNVQLLAYNEEVQNNATASADFRIVGGSELDEVPSWMVSLRETTARGEFRHICGATLIADKWVLSAAHCVDEADPTLYEVACLNFRGKSERS